MLKKISVCGAALILSASTLFAVGSDQPTATFKVSQKTAVPGGTLPPGTYTIHIVDHISDRYVVRVQSADGQHKTLFLGIPKQHFGGGSHGEINWSTPTEGARYIRGWNFSSLPPLEFAYPKNDAVAIAKANHAQVPAIDPESQGMDTKANLTPDQMRIVTLWLLSPTSVGPNSKAGIKAVRYQEVASAAQRPPIAKLPHTASHLPLLWLAGLLSLFAAMSLSVRRRLFER